MQRQVQIALILVLALQASAWAFPGLVVSVHDGDTITVLTEDNRQIKIRLYGIDAPELRQDFGTRSKQAMAAMVHGRQVEVEAVDQDRYGRTVAMITADGQTSVNEEMVRIGMAWVYPRYCRRPECDRWADLESQARSDGVGLWADPAPLAPWSWRRK